MKVSRVIEAKSVTSAYIGWRNTLQLVVDGGELNITLDEGSMRSIANVLNNKIAELEEEKAEAAAEATTEKENDE
jgi:ABC-type molybdate transport system ATPase subunit